MSTQQTSKEAHTLTAHEMIGYSYFEAPAARVGVATPLARDIIMWTDPNLPNHTPEDRWRELYAALVAAVARARRAGASDEITFDVYAADAAHHYTRRHRTLRARAYANAVLVDEVAR